jgi:aerobic-type carbon monoxide dehydrogenase small subunit (CoxS/CutS family)
VHFFDDKRVRTIEGHAKHDAQGEVSELNPIQQKFVDKFAFQCSYCTPGYVNAATVLVEKLQRQPVKRSELEGEIEDALGKHICRCTGYVRYYSAARDVVESLGLVKEG